MAYPLPHKGYPVKKSRSDYIIYKIVIPALVLAIIGFIAAIFYQNEHRKYQARLKEIDAEHEQFLQDIADIEAGNGDRVMRRDAEERQADLIAEKVAEKLKK